MNAAELLRSLRRADTLRDGHNVVFVFRDEAGTVVAKVYADRLTSTKGAAWFVVGFDRPLVDHLAISRWGR